jgi:hypothetical protein
LLTFSELIEKQKAKEYNTFKVLYTKDIKIKNEYAASSSALRPVFLPGVGIRKSG